MKRRDLIGQIEKNRCLPACPTPSRNQTASGLAKYILLKMLKN